MLLCPAVVSVIVSSFLISEAKILDNNVFEDTDSDFMVRSKKSPDYSAFQKNSEDDIKLLKSEYIKIKKTMNGYNLNLDNHMLDSNEGNKNTKNDSDPNLNKELDKLSDGEINEEYLRKERDYYSNSDAYQPQIVYLNPWDTELENGDNLFKSWRTFYNGEDDSHQDIPMYRSAFGAAGIRETQAGDSSKVQEDSTKQQEQQQEQQQQTPIVSPVVPISQEKELVDPLKHKGIAHIAHPIELDGHHGLHGHKIKPVLLDPHKKHEIVHPIKFLHADKIKPVLLDPHKKHEIVHPIKLLHADKIKPVPLDPHKIELALITKKIEAAIELLKKKKLLIDVEIKSKLALAAAVAALHHKEGGGHILVHDKHKHEGVDVPSFYSGLVPPYEVPTFYSYPETQANIPYPYWIYPQDYPLAENPLAFDRTGYIPPTYFSYPEVGLVEQSEIYPLNGYISPQTAPFYYQL